MNHQFLILFMIIVSLYSYTIHKNWICWILQILRLEFAHYDYRSCGIISAKDFALSLVASADIRHISKLLDRVGEVSNEPQIRDIRITFEEFKNFAELRRQLQYLSLAIFSYGKVKGCQRKKISRELHRR
jgi:hypothetical protein